MGQHNHLRLSLAALCFSLTVLIEGNFVSCSDQKQRGNPFRPRSHVVLRVENYHYEPNKKNEGLKMVLLQEVHEETTHGTAPEGDDDMTNFNDDGANPSSITKTSIKTTTTQLTFPNSLWNRWLIRLDEMDKLIIKSTLPLAAVFSIIPIVLFADLFWVNQLGDSLAVAGQSAANSVYQFAFGLLSFLPTVTATLVSKNHAKGDVEGTQDAIAQALVISFAISLTGTILLLSSPSRFLSFVRVKAGSPKEAISIPYLRIRSLSFIPQLIAFVGFSAFRGTMDLKSCVSISVISSVLNMILAPLLIHVFRFGVAGSGLAALTCDWITAFSYVRLMADRRLLVWRKLLNLPSWKQVLPLLKGSTLLLRSISMIMTQLMVARKIQSLDDSGVAPAAFALAMQTFQMGGVILFALGTATQTLYPNAVASYQGEDRQEYRRNLIHRLMKWGFGLGMGVSVVQLLFAPGILRSTPLAQVRKAALFPMGIVIAFQGINGLVSVGEGIVIGDGKFTRASINLVVASLGYMACLQLAPRGIGINGVFLSLVFFMMLRFLGVIIHLPSAMYSGDDDHKIETISESNSQ